MTLNDIKIEIKVNAKQYQKVLNKLLAIKKPLKSLSKLSGASIAARIAIASYYIALGKYQYKG